MPDADSLDLDRVTATQSELRGVDGSLLAAATDAEIEYYNTLLDDGLSLDEAYDRVAVVIARRFLPVTGTRVDPRRTR